jgi:hypothetical protein
MHSIGLKPRINKERCASLEEEKNGLKKWIRLAPGGFESNTQPSDLGPKKWIRLAERAKKNEYNIFIRK